MKNIIIIAIVCLTASYSFSQEKVKPEPSKTEKSGLIVFKSLEYDFGVLDYDAEAIAVFKFKNISKKPVILTNVRASCGCTGTEWPREEIAKKKKGEITVTYNSKIVGKFNKTVYVYIDGIENPIQLVVKGEVLNEEGESLKFNKNVPAGEIKLKDIETKKIEKVKINSGSEDINKTKNK
ncbi:MAG: DUF1573 domain-containing protein [Bacteroidales bacterium]|nr:DUF1573 domain-containing protein [Bacteroidales bacterium]HNQ69325.1 DUF1573 domain-containing protein [Bacteroidales bacterium]